MFILFIEERIVGIGTNLLKQEFLLASARQYTIHRRVQCVA